MTLGKPDSDGGSEAAEKPVFDATITPHRSLGQDGFRIVMTLVCLISVAASIPFMVLGAWPVAGFFGLAFSPMHRLIFLYYLILALALLTNLFVTRLRRLPVGRAWEALREDEIACRAMGMNTTNIKLSAFAIGAMLGGFAGVFFAARQGFISPESFTFTESATILAIVVLGGMGSQLGVVLAAVLLVLIPEFGRNFAEYRMLLFGASMVLIMIWKPGGLLAHREPTLRLVPAGSRETTP